jgi:hypothetical protein
VRAVPRVACLIESLRPGRALASHVAGSLVRGRPSSWRGAGGPSFGLLVAHTSSTRRGFFRAFRGPVGYKTHVEILRDRGHGKGLRLLFRPGCLRIRFPGDWWRWFRKAIECLKELVGQRVSVDGFGGAHLPGNAVVGVVGEHGDPVVVGRVTFRRFKFGERNSDAAQSLRQIRHTSLAGVRGIQSLFQDSHRFISAEHPQFREVEVIGHPLGAIADLSGCEKRDQVPDALSQRAVEATESINVVQEGTGDSCGKLERASSPPPLSVGQILKVRKHLHGTQLSAGRGWA